MLSEATKFLEQSKHNTNMSGRSLRHIPSDRLHVSTPAWWLESRPHFTYADYQDPIRDEFGVLRVLNDEIVQPRSGFNTHPHRDMELFTYVVEGEMSHEDSLGGQETLSRGSVQYLGSGSGMTHSEMNYSSTAMLRFLQAWIKPDGRGYPPSYACCHFSKEARHNKLQHVACGRQRMLIPGRQFTTNSSPEMLTFRQDVNIFVSEADPGVRQEFTLERRRQAYLVCMEGALSVNGVVMEQRDALEAIAVGTEALLLRLGAGAETGAHFLIIEMAGVDNLSGLVEYAPLL